MTKTVYLVMVGCYDEGVISSSIRVFDNEKAAHSYKQSLQERLNHRELYGVDYVQHRTLQVQTKPPSAEETRQYPY